MHTQALSLKKEVQLVFWRAPVCRFEEAGKGTMNYGQLRVQANNKRNQIQLIMYNCVQVIKSREMHNENETSACARKKLQKEVQIITC